MKRENQERKRQGKRAADKAEPLKKERQTKQIEAMTTLRKTERGEGQREQQR